MKPKLKIDKLSKDPKKVLALGLAQYEKDRLHYREDDDDDRVMDRDCKSYKGFEIGQVVYEKNESRLNDYTEKVVVGFSRLLYTIDLDTMKTLKLRRILVAGFYRGKLEGPDSQPVRDYTAKAVLHPLRKCPYCRRPTNSLDTCSRARCILQGTADYYGR